MTAIVIYDLLERLSSLTRIWFRLNPLLAELQPVQLSALVYLSRCNRYSDTPMAVTEYLGLTKGTVSQSLKVLETRGLLIKRPDVHDKRIVHLELTPEARDLLAAVMPPAFFTEGAASLGNQADTLQGLLMALLRGIQQAADVPSFGLCKTCRFHESANGRSFCNLTREPLSGDEAELLCREHVHAMPSP